MPKSNPALKSMLGTANNSKLRAEIEELKQELEELKLKTRAATSGNIPYYPIDLFASLELREGLKQPRKYFDQPKLHKLKDSISRSGVQEALLVRPVDNKLQIVSGERRWRCAAELGLTELPAISREMTDEEALEIAIVANLMREDLNLVEETDSIVDLISLRLNVARGSVSALLIKVNHLRNRKQYSDSEIADELSSENGYSGITTNLVSAADSILADFGMALSSFVANRLIAVQKMPAQLLGAVREGRVDFSKADLIRKAPECEQDALLKQAEEGLTKADLAEKVKALKSISGGKTEQDADMRDRIHQSYSQVRRKANWKKLEADSKLKKKLQRVESLLEELNQALSE